MADLPNLGLYRRMTALALVLGPALFLLDNILHPKELARGNEAQQLAEIGSHYQRWQFAHGIGLLSAVVMTGALMGLAFHVRRSQPTLGLIGGGAGGRRRDRPRRRVRHRRLHVGDAWRHLDRAPRRLGLGPVRAAHRAVLARG